MYATGIVSHERYCWHDPGSGAGYSIASEYGEPGTHPDCP